MVLLLLPRRSPRHPLPVAHCCCCYGCPSHFSKRTPCFFQLFSTNCCRVGPWQSFRSRSPHRTPCSRWCVSIDRFPTYNRCTLWKTLANNQTTREFNNTHIKIQQHKHKRQDWPFSILFIWAVWTAVLLAVSSINFLFRSFNVPLSACSLFNWATTSLIVVSASSSADCNSFRNSVMVLTASSTMEFFFFNSIFRLARSAIKSCNSCQCTTTLKRKKKNNKKKQKNKDQQNNSG